MVLHAFENLLAPLSTLRIAIKNRSAVTVSGLRVQINEMLNSYAAGPSSTYRVPDTLKPGQQTAIPTSIKGLTSADDARRYRTQVVAAQVNQ